ncbi:MAG TPA: winged helix-turn-helix domain-containing protein, partial [Nitrosospira sp.]|nr:winged helix-turn-helix domain-containing protein [Nitrosospira sp.]
MGEHEDKIYGFGDFRLQTEDGTLWRGEERVALTQKAVEMLTILVENPGRVVTRENLIERLWPETYVDENNLAVTASMLRKALGAQAFIETIPRKGYRFNGEVAVSTNGFVVAEREYTRAVIEHTEIDDEGANAAIAHLKNRARRQTVYLAGIALFTIALATVLGWTFFREGRSRPNSGNRSIAVLPFRDLTAGEDNKYFAIGLTDSLITK